MDLAWIVLPEIGTRETLMQLDSNRHQTFGLLGCSGFSSGSVHNLTYAIQRRQWVALTAFGRLQDGYNGEWILDILDVIVTAKEVQPYQTAPTKSDFRQNTVIQREDTSQTALFNAPEIW